MHVGSVSRQTRILLLRKKRTKKWADDTCRQPTYVYRARLFHLPNVVCLEKFGKVMVLLLLSDLVELRPDGIVIG